MSFLGYQIGDMLTSITANKFQVMLHEKIIIDRGKKKKDLQWKITKLLQTPIVRKKHLVFLCLSTNEKAGVFGVTLVVVVHILSFTYILWILQFLILLRSYCK
jgi:hypothetical protein